MSYSAIPNYREPFSQKGELGRSWYQFLVDIWKGRPQGAPASIIMTGSPFKYTATTKGFVIVQGGTVSLIQFTRGGVTNYSVGTVAGCFPLAQADELIVTYSAAPTLTWVPL